MMMTIMTMICGSSTPSSTRSRRMSHDPFTLLEFDLQHVADKQTLRATVRKNLEPTERDDLRQVVIDSDVRLMPHSTVHFVMQSDSSQYAFQSVTEFRNKNQTQHRSPIIGPEFKLQSGFHPGQEFHHVWKLPSSTPRILAVVTVSRETDTGMRDRGEIAGPRAIRDHRQKHGQVVLVRPRISSLGLRQFQNWFRYPDSVFCCFFFCILLIFK